MSPNAAGELFARCKELVALLRRSGDLSVSCTLQDQKYVDSRVRGMTCLDHDSRGSEECLYVDEASGMVVRCTWETSGHNGDSYGHRFVTLDPVEALHALQCFHNGVFARAVELEQRLMKEAERLRARAAAVQSLTSKLKAQR